MNKKNLICIFLLIIAIGVYYSYRYADDDEIMQSAANLNNIPVYQSDHMITDVYDVSGEILYKIESNNVKHFDNSDNTEFEQPNFTFYDQEHSATWLIQARKATLTNDKIIYLYQDVQLNNLTPNAQLQQVKTDNAVVDLTTQYVTSKDPVTITGIGFSSTGIGLASDMRAKTANILENVKTYYNPEAK